MSYTGKLQPNAGSCIAVVKFLECKLRAGLMYPCGMYVWKMYSIFSEFEVKMTLTVYGFALSYCPTTINHINLLQNIIYNK